ncbi:MAG: hypothetical protein U9532_03555 ['Conium maculatum' witches'-broom phytoplasma]|nr:hypothetical protein ['Conium maculatum' witches'-broom phytoplasma]
MKELIYDKYTADKIIALLEYKYYNNYKVHSITEYKPENLNLKKKETYYDKDNSDNIISFAEYAYTYESESTNAVSTIKSYSYTAYDGQNSHKIKEITYFKKTEKT